MNNSRFALAVVAKNYSAEILFIWGFGYHLCAPSQAEVATTLWAVHLAIQEHWKSVIIERDAQVCTMLYHHLTSLLIGALAPMLVTLIVYCLIFFLANLDRLGGTAIQQHMQLLD